MPGDVAFGNNPMFLEVKSDLHEIGDELTRGLQFRQRVPFFDRTFGKHVITLSTIVEIGQTPIVTDEAATGFQYSANFSKAFGLEKKEASIEWLTVKRRAIWDLHYPVPDKQLQ